MLTGKIYKNKLSADDDYYASTQQIYSSPLMRVKSQPGLKQIVYLAPENVEASTHQGTVRHQKPSLILNQSVVNQRSQSHNQIQPYLTAPADTNISASQCILEYEKKSREAVNKIEHRYESKVLQLQTALSAKNQIIQQLKQALREKESIIAKLESQVIVSTTCSSSRFVH